MAWHLLWNIMAHHPRKILACLTRFIPIFSLGTYLQVCLGSSQHFSLSTSLQWIEVISAQWIAMQTGLFTRLHPLTFSVEQSRTVSVWHSLTLSLELTLSKTCSRTCLHCWVFLNRLSSTIDGNTEWSDIVRLQCLFFIDIKAIFVFFFSVFKFFI